MTADIDPSTQANYTQIASEHVHFDWTIDWTKQVIAGSATHTLAVKEDGVKEVVYVFLYITSLSYPLNESPLSFDALALEIEKATVEDKAVDVSPSHSHHPVYFMTSYTCSSLRTPPIQSWVPPFTSRFPRVSRSARK